MPLSRRLPSVVLFLLHNRVSLVFPTRMTVCAVLRTFIVLWLATLPLAFVEKMGWWTLGVCVLVSYAVLGEFVGRDVKRP